MAEYYNLKNIRLLLTEGFTHEELLDLCFYEPILRPVYEDRSRVAGKSELVRSIIDRAHKNLAVETVLNWAEANNPARYENHQPYYQTRSLALKGPGLQLDALGAGSVLPDNALGKGISLGGSYRDIPLMIVASEWASYGISGEVRSGWLFVPEWTESHAVAFFKIHIQDEGDGYIHIVDASHPVHTIWLTTETGFRIEKEFHYATRPTDIWRFVWQK